MRTLHNVLNMPEYALTEFEMYFGYKYARILNMAVSENAGVKQGSKYAHNMT